MGSTFSKSKPNVLKCFRCTFSTFSPHGKIPLFANSICKVDYPISFQPFLNKLCLKNISWMHSKCLLGQQQQAFERETKKIDERKKNDKIASIVDSLKPRRAEGEEPLYVGRKGSSTLRQKWCIFSTEF